MQQKCARWGCDKSTTYDKPLCYEHWCEWDDWGLEECGRCHYYYALDENISDGVFGYDVCEEYGYPSMCDECLDLTLFEDGRERMRKGEPERKPIVAHADIKRPIRYVYILKLSDATFYIGQTNNLDIRLLEHKDGQQTQTRGKDPRLVYYDSFDGMRKMVDEFEMELTVLNSTETGRRKIRQLIEKFRTPLRLLDLDI